MSFPHRGDTTLPLIYVLGFSRALRSALLASSAPPGPLSGFHSHPLVGSLGCSYTPLALPPADAYLAPRLRTSRRGHAGAHAHWTPARTTRSVDRHVARGIGWALSRRHTPPPSAACTCRRASPRFPDARTGSPYVPPPIATWPIAPSSQMAGSTPPHPSTSRLDLLSTPGPFFQADRQREGRLPGDTRRWEQGVVPVTGRGRAAGWSGISDRLDHESCSAPIIG